MMRIWVGPAIACLASTPALADAEADALAHSKAFERAMSAADVRAAVALYSDDARVVFPGQGEEATGKAAIEKLLAETVDGLAGAPMRLESQKVIPLSGDYTAILGHWRIDFREPDGSTQTVRLRSSEVIRKDGDRSVYVVDHKSVGIPEDEAPPPTTADGPARP
jgi:ketosteroid isomerase-like protein